MSPATKKMSIAVGEVALDAPLGADDMSAMSLELNRVDTSGPTVKYIYVQVQDFRKVHVPPTVESSEDDEVRMSPNPSYPRYRSHMYSQSPSPLIAAHLVPPAHSHGRCFAPLSTSHALFCSHTLFARQMSGDAIPQRFGQPLLPSAKGAAALRSMAKKPACSRKAA